MHATTGHKVLITDKTDKLAAEVFQQNGMPFEEVPAMSTQELIDKLKAGGVGAIIVRSSTKFKEKAIFENRGDLKLIVRAGAGVDTIDVPMAAQHGVVVENTPGGNANATAEHAIALMFALARNIPSANDAMHKGRWEKGARKAYELAGKTLGVVGFGNIGAIVGKKAVALGMHVLAYDPNLTPAKANDLGVEKIDLDGLLQRADIVTLHAIANGQTRKMINAETLARMKKGAWIINCGRGSLIDEPALAQALKSGHIARAALDVMENEPTRDDPDGWKNNPFIGMDNVILTPHQSASTVEAETIVAKKAAEQIVAFFKTGTILNAVK